MTWSSVALEVAPSERASSSEALNEFQVVRKSQSSQLPFTPKSKVLQVVETQTRLAPVPVMIRAALWARLKEAMPCSCGKRGERAWSTLPSAAWALDLASSSRGCCCNAV